MHRSDCINCETCHFCFDLVHTIIVTSAYVRACACVRACVCFHIIPYINCFGRCSVFVQNIVFDECMINVHFYYYY